MDLKPGCFKVNAADRFIVLHLLFSKTKAFTNKIKIEKMITTALIVGTLLAFGLLMTAIDWFEKI